MGSLVFKSGADKIAARSSESFFNLKAEDIDHKEFDFASLKDKKAILVVNAASKCGFTDSNYTDLTKMYNELQSKGFEVLAFPCNQFFCQESGTNEDIKSFIVNKYKGTFKVFSPVEVNGEKAHPVFKHLRSNSQLYDENKQAIKEIPWNFSKFILNSDGKVVAFFPPTVKTPVVRAEIDKLLAEGRH